MTTFRHRIEHRQHRRQSTTFLKRFQLCCTMHHIPSIFFFHLRGSAHSFSGRACPASGTSDRSERTPCLPNANVSVMLTMDPPGQISSQMLPVHTKMYLRSKYGWLQNVIYTGRISLADWETKGLQRSITALLDLLTVHRY
jgi:hypothetical protein